MEFPKKRRRLIAGLAVGLLIVAWFVWPQPEPHYQGRPASDYVIWVLSSNKFQSQLIRAMGPDLAVSGLTRLLEKELSPWKKVHQFIYDHAPKRFLPSTFPFAQRLAYEATGLLGTFGAEAAGSLPTLFRQLDESDEVLRYCTVGALGNIGPAAQEAVPRLFAYLDSSDRNLQAEAAEALMRIAPNEQKLVDAMLAVLKSRTQGDMRLTAAAILRKTKLRPPGLAETLWNCAERGDLWAGPFLVDLNQRSDVDLHDCLTQLRATNSVRCQWAALVLGATRPIHPHTRTVLLEAQAQSNEAVRESASLALEWITEPRHGSDLWFLLDTVACLKFHDEGIRYNAMRSFTALGPAARSASSAVLTNLQFHSSVRVRAQAATALGAMCDPAADIVENLRRATEDKDATVRQAAERALVNLNHAAQSNFAPTPAQQKVWDLP